MSPATRIRSDLLRSLDRSLVVIAAAAMLLAGLELALLPFGEPAALVLAGLPVTFLIYIGAGLLAWHRRPGNRMGFLIVFAGFALYAGSIANTGLAPLMAVGAILATLVLPAIVHLLLAFPTGRLATTPARIVVIVSYVITLVLQAPQYLLDPEGPYPPFAIADAPELLTFFSVTQSTVGALIMVTVAVILIGRMVRAHREHRRLLVPVLAYGVVAVLFIPFSASILGGVWGLDSTIRGVLQFAVLAGIPVAFGLGVLVGGFARTAELEQLGSWLALEADRKDSLQAALARALGDPTVRLYFWAGETEGFVDEDGSRAGEQRSATGRGWVEVTLNERTIGAVAYDSSLITHRDTVIDAGNIVAIAMERQRLTADLLSSQRALVRSRERIVGAADRERRRVARDLHDGLQVQLVMLAVEAQQIASASVDSSVRGTADASAISERASRLRIDIDTAAADLRRLVHELVPAALIERGLGAAAEDLADRMPVPTAVDIEMTDGHLPEAAETTAYFVVAEALANVVKHAEATRARVELVHRDDTLRVTVTDDGRGGADPSFGTGLLGLADRVDVVGGTLSVDSVPGAGTILTAELPCAS